MCLRARWSICSHQPQIRSGPVTKRSRDSVLGRADRRVRSARSGRPRRQRRRSRKFRRPNQPRRLADRDRERWTTGDCRAYSRWPRRSSGTGRHRLRWAAERLSDRSRCRWRTRESGELLHQRTQPNVPRWRGQGPDRSSLRRPRTRHRCTAPDGARRSGARAAPPAAGTYLAAPPPNEVVRDVSSCQSNSPQPHNFFLDSSRNFRRVGQASRPPA